MSAPVSLEAVEAEALKLSPQDRADLAERLWMSVAGEDGRDVQLDPAWDAEIRRRVAADDAGQTRYMPAQEALDRLGEHIRRRLAERRG